MTDQGKTALLSAFKAEILDKGPEASLPRNLPDKWLDILADDLEEMLSETDDENETGESRGIFATGAVVSLLDAKCGSNGQFKVPMEQLFNHYIDYRIEINMEIVHRRTDMKYEAATLANIFTNRDVTFWKDPLWNPG
jgi:hypothetical protein